MDRLTAAEILATSQAAQPEPADLDYWAAFSIGTAPYYLAS